MPQILVDHSTELAFDHAVLAADLHKAVTEVIDTSVAECKTLFRPAPEHTVGDGTAGEALVLVELKILAGRSTELRAELTARVVEVLRSHIVVPTAIGVQVTELDRDTYRFVHHTGG
ncbi:isomerase [Kitasatospora sp. NPDC089797]|uniref:5-carboxymethyl-2-hydroxymuconate Delta-isomerase n=1 Tax=Kitasatospora sp. NPDC089797 TaxID=3155298 RepID=UPI00341AC9C2